MLERGEGTDREEEGAAAFALVEGMHLAAWLAGGQGGRLPEEVDRLLREEKKFTTSSDVPKVSELYRGFFQSASQSKSLSYSLLGWGDAKAVELAIVLPHFTRLESLDMSRNEIGAEGGSALARAADHARHTGRRCSACC